MAEEVKDDRGSRGEPARRKAGEGKNRLDVVKRHPGPFQHNAKLGSVKWHHAPVRKVIPPGFVRFLSSSPFCSSSSSVLKAAQSASKFSRNQSSSNVLTPVVSLHFVQNELTFNALPLSSRLASTKLFVRDLTVLSRHADAIVMTGSSNVGRLMALLFEAARVERGVEGRREMRSLDTRCVALSLFLLSVADSLITVVVNRWFPTSKFS
jgi:hypothetical protein